jgi:ketosteroid isomerase-like protein
MTPIYSILRVVSVILFFGLAGARSATKVDDQHRGLQVTAETDWEFKQLVNEYLRAWSPGCRKFDMESAAQFYETTDQFSGYHFLAPMEEPAGWQRYGSAMAKIMSDFNEFTILPDEDDFLFKRNGSQVSTAISYRAVGKNREGKALDTRARVLLIWKRVNDRWLISREDVTALLGVSNVARN